MSAVATSRVTHEQFFALCERSESGFEYVAGVVVAMARGSYAHAAILSRIGARMDAATTGGPCRSFTDSLSVYIDSADAIRTPDVVVACPPNVIKANQGLIDNPAILVEVTSPSTRAIDHSDKLREYASVPSVRHYVLVDSEAMHVQMFSRLEDGAWRLELLTRSEDSVVLPMLSLSLTLGEIY
ncbi:Uma2 family endonuclease, partial [bacterium]